jgi:hypothetical protein
MFANTATISARAPAAADGGCGQARAQAMG